jgi:hypothetical protein
MKAGGLAPSITAIMYAPKMENKRAAQAERRVRDMWWLMWKHAVSHPS